MLSQRMPDLSALEVFVTVAGSGSLNSAAAVLGVSQQAISARITSIERQSGVQLLERTRRGSTLTPAGVVFAEWASQILAVAGEMDAGLTALRQDAQTTLHIAASLTIAEYLLPAWLVELQAAQAPNHRSAAAVDLKVTNSVGVAACVIAGEAELGFVEGPTPPRGLRHRTIGHDTMVVVVAPSHPWIKRRGPIGAHQLARASLVVREHGSGTREALVFAITKALGTDVELAAPVLSLPTTAAVRAAVLAGAGPAVLSELAVADDLLAGRLRAISVEGLDLHRALRAVWRSSARVPSRAARQLLDLATVSSTRGRQELP